MKRGDILDAVKNTITKDRNDRHGEPENSFPRIAEEWSRYLTRLQGSNPALKPSDVAEMLAIFKTCRFETQPDNADNEHDRIGYYAIAAELRASERAGRGSAHGFMRVNANKPSKRHIYTSMADFPTKGNFEGEEIELQLNLATINEVFKWLGGSWRPQSKPIHGPSGYVIE